MTFVCIAKGAKKIRREAYKVSLRILRQARQNLVHLVKFPIEHDNTLPITLTTPLERLALLENRRLTRLAAAPY